MLSLWILSLILTGFISAVVTMVRARRWNGGWYVRGRTDQQSFDDLVRAGYRAGGELDDPPQIFAEQLWETGLPITVGDMPPWDQTPRCEILGLPD